MSVAFSKATGNCWNIPLLCLVKSYPCLSFTKSYRSNNLLEPGVAALQTWIGKPVDRPCATTFKRDHLFSKPFPSPEQGQPSMQKCLLAVRQSRRWSYSYRKVSAFVAGSILNSFQTGSYSCLMPTVSPRKAMHDSSSDSILSQKEAVQCLFCPRFRKIGTNGGSRIPLSFTCRIRKT
jgi:hypothetical protein